MNSRGMVQVYGHTYRIIERGALHDVVRILDDGLVGTFRNGPQLEVVRSEIPAEKLCEIAKLALTSARLAWRPRPQPARTSLLPSLRALLATWHRGSAWLAPHAQQTPSPGLQRAFD